MKLSDRDKALIFVLAIVAVLCLPYYFVVRPYTDKISVIETELIELKNRKSELEALMLRREEFETDTAALKVEKEKLLNRFPASLAQENTLLFFDHMEELLQISLFQISTGEEVPIPIGTGEIAIGETGTEETGTGETAAGETGTAAAAPEGGSEENQDGTAAAETADMPKLEGSSTSSQINYTVGYKNFKEFLDYIGNYRERMVITQLQASYIPESDAVDGNLTLLQYAVTGEDRIPEKAKEPDIGKGTGNVFLQAAGRAGENTKGESASADFFMMLSQPKADVEAIMIGQSEDGSGKTYLTSKENAVKEVTIRFEGSEGKYTAIYRIGDEQYAKDGISFSKEGDIGFEILSSARVGEKDKVAVNLKISNKTDRKVQVSVKDDDKENKRVKISEKTGDITVR